MSHLFCHSCGNKLSYTHAKPNFCHKCGQELNATASTNSSEGMETIEKSVVISSDETDALSVPHISNFQVDVENTERKTVTLGSLIGESDAKPPAAEGGNRSRSINEFIDEKKRER